MQGTFKFSFGVAKDPSGFKAACQTVPFRVPHPAYTFFVRTPGSELAAVAEFDSSSDSAPYRRRLATIQCRTAAAAATPTSVAFSQVALRANCQVSRAPCTNYTLSRRPWPSLPNRKPQKAQRR